MGFILGMYFVRILMGKWFGKRGFEKGFGVIDE